MLERMLVGETLSLDLVNTEWVDHGETVDLLTDADAADAWFRDYGFDPALEDLGALRVARHAIRSQLDSPGPEADASLNAVLEHGCERTVFMDGRPEPTTVTDPGWGAAWAAAAAFAELLATRPERVRQCAHPDCVLYFVDTSRNGGRRWHSMETCGARTKSARHYRRKTAVDRPSGTAAEGDG